MHGMSPATSRMTLRRSSKQAITPPYWFNMFFKLHA
jgi:hypothetical protein